MVAETVNVCGDDDMQYVVKYFVDTPMVAREEVEHVWKAIPVLNVGDPRPLCSI